MKTIHKFITGAALAFALSVPSLRADQPGMTQRAAANHLELQRVHGPRNTELPQTRFASVSSTMGGKAWAQMQESRRPVASGPSIDLAHAPRPVTASKDPDFDRKLRENAQSKIEVAPLK